MTPPLKVGTMTAGALKPPQSRESAGISTHELSKSYGPVRALDNVSLQFAPGEVHAVLGQNGSGKSTLVKLLSGTLGETAGSVVAAGETVRLGSTAAAARAGIVTVFQELSVLPSLTVAENILLGRYRRSIIGTINRREMHARAGAILDRFQIELPLGASCRTLSLSQLQLVEIARALATEPKLLILDEATSSLDKPDAENLLRISRELAEAGNSVLFVSHRMDEVFAVAHTVSVITDGKLVSSSPVADVTRVELLTQLSGKALQPLERLSRESSTSRGEVALEADIPALGDASVVVHRGEIVGIAGLQGHGQKEAMRAIAGADTGHGFRIRVAGKAVSRPSVHRMLARGVAYVPEDRGSEGLLLKHTVRSNATLSALPRVSRLGFLSARSESRLATEIISMLSVKIHTNGVPVDTLSGGNQQKVLIGRALLTEPKIVLLDDPTRGIDAGAKADIYSVLRRLADAGVGILFNSTELPEIVGLCDRVLVFHDSAVVAELAGDQITEAEILKNMLGA